ncbi:RHS repeat-associated core domain-containing protein [Halomonas sp. ISL-56]|uniref:RHS repeat-associated core domain-containing protein n=1 Tax=Halomonas sp. ISL-56 TaxID=2819149 RepID=UPI002551F71B|nr:RHS repeat-associated core domain-containing protein [Halomonas sp. ISL-56]
MPLNKAKCLAPLSPTQLVAPNDQPRWLAEPDNWAAVKNQRAVRNVTQPIRFQGQWHDEESGLYYNRHRYYDPQQGQYISQDPIGLNGGTNLYGYVSNPAGMVDPLGLLACFGLCIAGAVVGGTAVVNWTRNYWNEPVSDITDVDGWTELTPEE